MLSLPRVGETFRTRLLTAFSWNVVAALMLQGSVLFSSILVARFLGLAAFGMYSIVISTALTIAAIAQSSSGLMATKFVGESIADPDKVGRILRMCRMLTFATGIISGAIVMSFAGALSGDLLRQPDLESSVRLIGLAIFFLVAASYQVGALQGLGAFKELSVSSAIVGVAYITSTSIGASTHGIDGALIGFVVASAFRYAAFALCLRSVGRRINIPGRGAIRLDEFRSVWKFTLPSSLAGAVTVSCLWFALVIVARQADGLELVAILSAAHQIRATVLQFPLLLNGASFSVLSRLKGTRHLQAFHEVFQSTLLLNAAFVLIIVLLASVLARPILSVYGDSFANATWVLVILLLSAVPETLAVTAYQLVQSSGQMWRSLLLVVLPRDSVYLGFTALLLPYFGAAGVAAAYFGAWLLAMSVILCLVRALGTSR